MKHARLVLIALLQLGVLSSCATPAGADRSTVNRPQMAIESSPFDSTSPLTGLGAKAAAPGGASCTVCAH